MGRGTSEQGNVIAFRRRGAETPLYSETFREQAIFGLEATFMPGDTIFTQIVDESPAGVVMRVFARPNGKGRYLNESSLVAFSLGLAFDAQVKTFTVSRAQDDPEGWIAGRVAQLVCLEIGDGLGHVSLPQSDETPKVTNNHQAGLKAFPGGLENGNLYKP